MGPLRFLKEAFLLLRLTGKKISCLMEQETLNGRVRYKPLTCSFIADSSPPHYFICYLHACKEMIFRLVWVYCGSRRKPPDLKQWLPEFESGVLLQFHLRFRCQFFQACTRWCCGPF